MNSAEMRVGLSGLFVYSRLHTGTASSANPSTSDVVRFDDCGDHLPHARLDGRAHFQSVIGVRQRAPGSA